jgi:murein DD-endopeptidase MepM/ murein hydrolase activator NlpD
LAGVVALSLFGSAGVGFQLQAHLGLAGPAAHQLRQCAARRWERWGSFERTVSTLQGEETVSLRRRGAIVHALKLGLGNRRAASQLLSGMVTPEWRSAAERGAAGNGSLLWPVESGWYVRGYGSGEDGYHLAVDIMGPRGSDVRAAAAGIVGYAGNGVRGFGNLVMLIHPGGWVTAYAHNDAHHVVAGERVARGQPIAALGNTGISRGPHVHFEFMHGGRNCDPVPLFRPGVRHRPGHLGALAQALWPAGAPRPVEVRCEPRRAHPHSRWVDAETAHTKAQRDRPSGPELAGR